MPLTVVGPIYTMALTFDGSTLWAALHQFEVAAHLNKWTEEEKGLSLILVKGPSLNYCRQCHLTARIPVLN